MGMVNVLHDTDLDVALRLAFAAALGVAFGLERALRGKPTGMRTLGLVSFTAALVTLGTAHAPGIISSTDALSRILQGVDQGVLVGVGFLGAGIILRDMGERKIINVTTAAQVWAVAAMGLTSAVAPWPLIGIAVGIMFVLVVVCRALEYWFGFKDQP
jgi:putative Mg2+ transporter-C (MgtC) family protein